MEFEWADEDLNKHGTMFWGLLSNGNKTQGTNAGSCRGLRQRWHGTQKPQGEAVPTFPTLHGVGFSHDGIVFLVNFRSNLLGDVPP